MTNCLGGKATTNGGTLITIPANSVWHGSVTLSALGDSAGTFYPDVTVQGATADPVAGTPVISVLSFGAVVGLVPEVTTGSTADVIVFAGSSPATLQLNLNSTTAAVATAIGYFQ